MTSAFVNNRVHWEPAALERFCRQHRIVKLSLYGSVLREDFGPKSDVDVLVEFEPGQNLGLFTFSRIALELDELLGREVDLKTPADFPADVRCRVLATAETIYALN